MRKLALSDEILLSVQQPARYIGGEVNMRVKDPKKADIRFAMCFPDVYEIRTKLVAQTTRCCAASFS